MIVTSRRVNLRFYKSSDIRPIFDEYTSDIESTKFLARDPHYKLEQTREMMKKLSNSSSLKTHKKCIWVICHIRQNIPIGYITLQQHELLMEIHFGIGKPHRGQGYASEAIYLSSKYIISESLAKNVISYTDKENLPAQFALKKASFNCIGEYQKYYLAPLLGEEKRDVFYYKFNLK